MLINALDKAKNKFLLNMLVAHGVKNIYKHAKQCHGINIKVFMLPHIYEQTMENYLSTFSVPR